MISVVIPLYNKGQSIGRTLQSVMAQSYRDFEVVVVDDGSTDQSRQVVDDYQKSLPADAPIVRVFSKSNGGVCSARNMGIREARGNYIALLDADDLWDKDYLAEQVKMISDFPSAAMWGINFAEMDNGRLVRELATGLDKGFRGYVKNYFQMSGRISDLFCSSSVVIRRDVFDEVGYFDERIKYSEDSDMWFRIIATHQVAFYERYMVYYQHDAENRAMNQHKQLRYWLPYFVDKYSVPPFSRNAVFYRWIMRWSAQYIRLFYFGADKEQWKDAKVAAKKLNYDVVPFKYRLLFGLPYCIGNMLDRLDRLRKRI